jgi:methylmalonyl-CoA mutase, C-terminal domain
VAKGRILIGKPGLDGHDRGAKYIVRLLGNAGYDVIYTGIRRSPEQIVDAAIEHNVDAIGLSVMSGAHKVLFERVLDLLKEKGANRILVFGGGLIHPDDFPFLSEIGVKEIFTAGASAESILTAIDRMLGERARQTVN